MTTCCGILNAGLGKVYKNLKKSVTLNGEVINEPGFDTGYGIWRLEEKDFKLILEQSSVQKRHHSRINRNTPEITDNFWENLSTSKLHYIASFTYYTYASYL